MKVKLEQMLPAALEALGYDMQMWEKIKERRLPEAIKVKQFVAYLGYGIEGYPMTRIGAFLGLSHSTVSSHYHNAVFFLEHEREYREAMYKALEIIDRLKGAQKQVTIRGWAARDNDGSVWVFTEMSERSRSSGGVWVNSDPHTQFLKMPDFDCFSHITWESEPQEAEITIKLK